MLFYYAGRVGDGKRVTGSIEASSRTAAAGHLRGRAVFLTSLEPGTTVRGAWTLLGISLRRDSVTHAALFRSFATLVEAGIPVRRALETLIRQSRGPLCEALESVVADVEDGVALSKAMQLHPREFSNVAIAIVKAGEVGGSLDEALRVVADLEERDRNFRKRVGAAISYPSVVTVAASGLVLFLLANTMPAFAAMFAAMHVSLPLATRLLIAVGRRLHEPIPWVALSVLVAVGGVAARRFKSSESAWAIAVDRLRLGLPILGPVIAKTTVARFARTLGSLLRAGVDISAALEASRGVVEGSIYRNGLLAVSDALRRGEALLSPFESSRLFDATFLQLLRAGEESGNVDGMLLRLAQYYEADVESALVSFTSILEPLLICALGAAIGTIVASIIIPLYTMIGNIQ